MPSLVHHWLWPHIIFKMTLFVIIISFQFHKLRTFDQEIDKPGETPKKGMVSSDLFYHNWTSQLENCKTLLLKIS